MFPPQPTKDPHTVVQNLWGSLKRAAEGHWADQATIDPAEGGAGFDVTIRTHGKIPQTDWDLIRSYTRRYARASHWKLSDLTKKKTHVRFHLEYSPPIKKKKGDRRKKSRPAPDRASPETPK